MLVSLEPDQKLNNETINVKENKKIPGRGYKLKCHSGTHA
jgi:hypothetical protein